MENKQHSMKNRFEKRYRIVRDHFNGYECQVKHWWLPIWFELNGTNSHRTVELARAFIDTYAEVISGGEFVEYYQPKTKS
mgnify:FL=1